MNLKKIVRDIAEKHNVSEKFVWEAMQEHC